MTRTTIRASKCRHVIRYHTDLIFFLPLQSFDPLVPYCAPCRRERAQTAEDTLLDDLRQLTLSSAVPNASTSIATSVPPSGHAWNERRHTDSAGPALLTPPPTPPIANNLTMAMPLAHAHSNGSAQSASTLLHTSRPSSHPSEILQLETLMANLALATIAALPEEAFPQPSTPVVAPLPYPGQPFPLPPSALLQGTGQGQEREYRAGEYSTLTNRHQSSAPATAHLGGYTGHVGTNSSYAQHLMQAPSGYTACHSATTVAPPPPPPFPISAPTPSFARIPPPSPPQFLAHTPLTRFTQRSYPLTQPTQPQIQSANNMSWSRDQESQVRISWGWTNYVHMRMAETGETNFALAEERQIALCKAIAQRKW